MKKNGRILGLLLAVIMTFSMIINVATIHAEETGEPINETPAANQEGLEEPADDDGGREPAPKTADGSSLYLWYALASASSLSYVLISRKKKH